MHNLIKIKSISKYNILDKKSITNSNFSNINLSSIFWGYILDKNNFKYFVEKKFKPYKKQIEDKDSYNYFVKEYNFLLEKIDYTKLSLDFINKEKISSWEDIVFSYRIYEKILSYYNEYYSKDNIFISLSEALVFTEKLDSIDDFFTNLEKYNRSNLVNELILPILDKNFNNLENNIYKFEIFWPDELITVWIISKYLKNIDKNVKIVVDFSQANEQFDFTNWIVFIKDSNEKFFKIIDYFIIYRDFSEAISNILKIENGFLDKKNVENIIYYDNWVVFNEVKKDKLNSDLLEVFIKDTFNPRRITKILRKNFFSSRLLPYKCYWSKCNFCAINSNNKFSYDNKYSYDYFVDKWIDFIKENNIYFINFSDEALPPIVIIKFAKKVLENKLEINYQFRTRYEKLYNQKNCKILAESWARYCWIGLEAVSTRINEQIWNKWNSDIDLKEKIKIIHNFDSSWIAIHNYAILGFPWETSEEYTLTYKFLKSNIIKSNYFTTTPNIFWLMKWPEIFNNRDKYKIEINNLDLENPFKLIYDFKVDWNSRNMKLLYSYNRDLHRAQFLPWIDENNSLIAPKAFWDFIDRSYIFYLFKRLYRKNPYHRYLNINNNIIESWYDKLINSYFYISSYNQIFEYNNDENIYIYNWVECKDIIILKKYKDLIVKYDNSLMLSENIDKLSNSITKEIIYYLIKNRILISNN